MIDVVFQVKNSIRIEGVFWLIFYFYFIRVPTIQSVMVSTCTDAMLIFLHSVGYYLYTNFKNTGILNYGIG